MNNQRELFKGLAILSLCVMLLGGTGPWGSDVLGFFFNQELKGYITFGAFIASLFFFLGYLKVDRESSKGFIKKGGRLYASVVLEQLEENNIDVESIENVIVSGTQTKRAQSFKYSGTVGSKKMLVYTNLNNAVTDVVL